MGTPQLLDVRPDRLASDGAEPDRRLIEEEVRRATFRETVELILVPGARPVDLLRKLNEKRPQVVHFSSHGNPAELVLVPGARPVDLLRKLNESQPQVVHFSSHGSPEEIYLESEDIATEDVAGQSSATTRSSGAVPSGLAAKSRTLIIFDSAVIGASWRS